MSAPPTSNYRAGVLAFALLVLAAEPPPGDADDPFLTQAKVFAQGQEFEKCLKRLEAADKKTVSNHRLAEIDLYTGLCQIGLGNEKGALASWELGLRLDPTLQLPPLQSPKVRDLFEKLRAQLPAPPPKKEEKKPDEAKLPHPSGGSCTNDAQCSVLELCIQGHCQPPPPQVPVVEKEKHLVAPLVLGGLGVVAAGVGVTFGVLSQNSLTDAKNAEYGSVARSLRDQAVTQALAANISYGAAAAALLAALITWFVLN